MCKQLPLCNLFYSKHWIQYSVDFLSVFHYFSKKHILKSKSLPQGLWGFLHISGYYLETFDNQPDFSLQISVREEIIFKFVYDRGY